MNVIYENDHAVIKGVTDLDIYQTFDCGQCFRFDPCPDGGIAGIACGKWARFEQPFDDTLIIYAPYDDIDFWMNFLSLDVDYGMIKEDIRTRFGGDTISMAMNTGYGIRILRQDPWETVCSFIISQNNNIPRIKKIIASLSEKFGEKIGDTLYAFPTAKALCDAGEEEIFLLKTGFRAKYIYDAAARVCDGRLDLDNLRSADTDVLMKTLCEVKGIGPKVASCSALFGFYRTEAFPIDVWVKRVIEKYYPDGLDIASLGKYAGIAQQYLFYYERYINND